MGYDLPFSGLITLVNLLIGIGFAMVAREMFFKRVGLNPKLSYVVLLAVFLQQQHVAWEREQCPAADPFATVVLYKAATCGALKELLFADLVFPPRPVRVPVPAVLANPLVRATESIGYWGRTLNDLADSEYSQPWTQEERAERKGKALHALQVSRRYLMITAYSAAPGLPLEANGANCVFEEEGSAAMPDFGDNQVVCYQERPGS